MDITITKILNELQQIQPKFRLTYPKNLTSRQKRAIRNAFNQIQPKFIELVEKEMVDAVIFGNTLHKEVKYVGSLSN
jgi:hypothetical protein